MAQQIVTQKAVDAAAEAIAGTGAKPTVRLIHDRLGGSFTTIQKYLADWQERQRNRPIPDDVVVPDHLLTKSVQMVRALYAEVLHDAKQQIDTATATADEQVAAAAAELSDATQEIARLEHQQQLISDECAALRRRVDELGKLNSALEERASRASELETSLLAAREALAKSEQRATDLEAQLGGAGDVKAHLARLEEALAALNQKGN